MGLHYMGRPWQHDSSSCLEYIKFITEDYLQRMQTLHFLQRYLKQKLFTKVIKMSSLKAWVKRPNHLIKRGRKSKHFKIKLDDAS